MPMYDRELVDLYTRLLEWSTVDAEDIDDDKYLFAKKFSEVSRVCRLSWPGDLCGVR